MYHILGTDEKGENSTVHLQGSIVIANEHLRGCASDGRPEQSKMDMGPVFLIRWQSPLPSC